MKKSILFVDDEANVLHALRRMLYDMGGEWDMAFADSGTKALEIMAGKPFDLLITDMRMPGLDGVGLLEQAMTRYPDTIRIILSGQTDREAALRAVKLAHQFLFKPCSAKDLKDIIRKALRLKGIFVSDAVKAAVSRIESLPSFPPLYHELLAEIDREDSSIQHIGEIISKDVSMTASILKLVNSSFFGLSVHVSSPAHAVSLLGTDIIRGLVLTVHLFSEFKFPVKLSHSFKLLWDHSLNTAFFAKAIAGLEGLSGKDQDNCFLAAILHDVGKLVLAANFAEEYATLLDRSKEENRTIGDVELDHYGFNHAGVGGYLLGLWGLAEPIAVAVAMHHQPEPGLAPGFAPLHAVHAANAIEHELTVINKAYAPHPVDTDFLAADGLLDRLPVWREACAAILAKHSAPKD